MRVIPSAKHGVCVLAVVSMFISSTASGTSIHSSQTGDWNSSATWVGSVVPGAADTVVVENGHVVTLTSPGSCNALYILAGNAETGVVLDTSGALAVSGGVQVTAPTTNNSAYLDGCDGFVTIGGDVALVGGSNANRHAKLMIAGGSSSVAGSISMNNNRARISFAGTGTLTIGGDVLGDGV